MAKRKREIDKTTIEAMREQVRQERLALRREIAQMPDERREAVAVMFERRKQRSPIYVEVLSKRPKSDRFRRHFEDVLLEEAVDLVKHPPKPTGQELVHLFIRDMLAEVPVGATFEDVKAWARVKYPDVARHWK